MNNSLLTIVVLFGFCDHWVGFWRPEASFVDSFSTGGVCCNCVEFSYSVDVPLWTGVYRSLLYRVLLPSYLRIIARSIYVSNLESYVDYWLGYCEHNVYRFFCGGSGDFFIRLNSIYPFIYLLYVLYKGNIISIFLFFVLFFYSRG